MREENSKKRNQPEKPMNNPSVAVNAGSFRDRNGRVYHYKDQVFRGLNTYALENFRVLNEKSFYQSLLEQGKIIGTREIESHNNPLPDVYLPRP